MEVFMDAGSKFSGKLGFVLAATGSAVGLGNIWRFPYLAAHQSGGLFIPTYIILVIFVGFFLSITETAIGRKTGRSALTAFGTIKPGKNWFGLIPAIVPVIILPYYSVVGGWVVKYLGAYIAGNSSSLVLDSSFSAFISRPIEPIVCFLIYLACNAAIVMLGVQKGIEKASCIMMPTLFVLCTGIAIYTLTLPGAMEGMRYLFVPDFSQFSFETVLSAMSQMFYSLSLSMGVMITYGAYMKKDIPMDSAMKQVCILGSVIAIIASVMVVPAVFAFSGGDPEALSKGAGLMFVTLPKVFASIPGGSVIGLLFFILVFFAALTSSISLFEAIISELMEITKLSRAKACLWVFLGSLVLGSLASLGFGPLKMIRILGFSIFDFCDFLSNNLLMPVGALLICIFTAWVSGPGMVIDEVMLSSKFRSRKVYAVIIKYVAPLIIIAVMVTSVLEGLGILSF
jgi:neurotransmitter:Na+ symporter, NSS family